jgi:hypothetical protein
MSELEFILEPGEQVFRPGRRHPEPARLGHHTGFEDG